MCFNKVEGPKTLRRHTLVKNSITQITEDFIKKIGEIFKESEKLYETSVFPNDDSLLKMLCSAQADITRNRTGRRRDWGEIHSQLEIFFADRLPQQRFTAM
mgnify:FL=1